MKECVTHHHACDCREAALAAEIAALKAVVAAQAKGLEAVVVLMNESHGADGLHFNGNVATWGELRTGGRYEEWLMDFDAALNLADTAADTADKED